MINKIWYFGDCFTKGIGCWPGQPYFEYRDKDDDVWVSIVAKHFKTEYERPDYSLGATMYIVINLIQHLKHIKENDLIIISDSEVKSTLSIGRNKSKVKCISSMDFNNNIIGSASNDALYNIDWHSDKEKQSIIDYINEQIVPYQDIWEQFYVDLIKDIAVEVKNRGINTIFWSHHLWKTEKRFESIKQATNGKFDDEHFSWKGHRDFAEYMINRIENKEWLI